MLFSFPALRILITLYQGQNIGSVGSNIGIVSGVKRLYPGILLQNTFNISHILFSYLIGRQLVVKSPIGDFLEHELRFSAYHIQFPAY
jgi:hypothetical protein